MALLVATVVGLLTWIVLWSLGAKGFDAFMVTMLVVVVGATIQLAVPYLPGRRR
jgi:hypothetical protein